MVTSSRTAQAAAWLRARSLEICDDDDDDDDDSDVAL